MVAIAGRERDPCQHRCTRTDLDPAHPLHNAGRCSCEIRQASPNEATGTAELATTYVILADPLSS
jgi:hypothetical protein